MISYLKIEFESLHRLMKLAKEVGIDVYEVESIKSEFINIEAQEYLEMNSEAIETSYSKVPRTVSFDEYEAEFFKRFVARVNESKYFSASVDGQIEHEFWDTLENMESI